MNLPTIHIPKSLALLLEDFKKMDYYAVENYVLSIGLMMENAGLNLARLVAGYAPKGSEILIGVGPGNNGGGGLVAGRRLSAWGYQVFIDLPKSILAPLATRQLERLQAFGLQPGIPENPAVVVDAYLGFSQRLPLRGEILKAVQRLNELNCKKVSLDLPTGFGEGAAKGEYFMPDAVCTLAAPKKLLYDLNPEEVELFIADLGIPGAVYEKFEVGFELPFEKSGLVRLLI